MTDMERKTFCPARIYGAAAKLCDMESLCEEADIFARLNRYWSEKGAGAMNKLSEACGLDASKLYLMQRNDGKFDIEHWRAVSAGLDKLGYGGMR